MSTHALFSISCNMQKQIYEMMHWMKKQRKIISWFKEPALKEKSDRFFENITNHVLAVPKILWMINLCHA